MDHKGKIATALSLPDTNQKREGERGGWGVKFEFELQTHCLYEIPIRRGGKGEGERGGWGAKFEALKFECLRQD